MNTLNTLSTLRWCEDIGMFAYDRSIPASCVHATAFCNTNCYNDKLYRMYPSMRTKDIRNEEYWASITGYQVKADLQGKRKQTARVRFMTRGEAFSGFSDIARVEDILMCNPDVTFWIPTRAWRNPLMRVQIESISRTYANVRILASVDPTTTREEWEMLTVNGWSTMFFGDNDMRVTPVGSKMFLCPKTHGAKVKGACSVCKRGCFRSDKRVDVHLRQH